MYIDGNTQNLFGIENAAQQIIFTGDNLVDELISLLFDPLQANQTLAAQLLLTIEPSNILVQNKRLPLLASAFSQLVELHTVQTHS